MSGFGYNVYKVQYNLAMQDPLIPGPTRYHTVLFVETDNTEGGHIFHVTGDIVSGMRYDTKRGRKPETSETFYARTYLGRIRVEDYPDRLDQLLRTIPAPGRQRAFNRQTMATEQIKPDGSFYGPHEPRPQFVKCTEWTEQLAIPAIQQQQLLRNDLHPAPLGEPDVQSTPAVPEAQVAPASQAAPGSSLVWDAAHGRWRFWNGQEWIWR